MNELTPVANAQFEGTLAEEIVRLNKVIKELETVTQNLYKRIEFLQAEIVRLETSTASQQE